MVYSATDEDSVTLITLIHSREMKENFDPSTKRKSHTDLNLEDDRPIDPVPSSKATVKPKPIAHGSPLMPYITAAKWICIANCRECVFFLGVAPYNTFYPQLEEDMSQVSVDATINRWNEPLVLGMVDPHDSLSHPTGVSDVQAESTTSFDPDQFTIFLIPNRVWRRIINVHKTKSFPITLEVYMASRRKISSLEEIKQALQDIPLEENRNRELSCALHVHFKDWLYGEIFLLQTPPGTLSSQIKMLRNPEHNFHNREGIQLVEALDWVTRISFFELQCISESNPEIGAILADATPIGMHPNTNRIPVATETLGVYHVVFDSVYTPRKMQLLKEVEPAGAIVVSGVEMFLRQEMGQFNLFTGWKGELRICL
ncbi:hypothetical protein IFM89_031106 [Coptis chinensis]|uniref:Uncharacterized protein n=1 Tax=Coptis chinensis TaxID=261450 RepID=A0A835IVE9_9MAGN|nr:hypothetical protein IFM89_031106 [Coptis chinensis]